MKTGCRAKNPAECRYHGNKTNTAIQTKDIEKYLTLREQQTLFEKLIPTSDSEYYKATEEKHFINKNAPGSQFTSNKINNLKDILSLAVKQRGNLEGDDRNKFLQLGANPKAFLEGIRYLYVETPGTVGVINSEELPDITPISVIRTKPGTPCSLTIQTETKPITTYGVIIIGKDGGQQDVLWTAFPGQPTVLNENPEIELLEGKTVTLKTIRNIVGDVWLHTQIK